jgi:hypothetical protein
MAEQRWQVADDQITPELRRLAFLSPVESSVMTGGRLQGQNAANQVIKRSREKGHLQTLQQVEIALQPLPDEPPITYPSADRWEALTLRRKQHEVLSLGGHRATEQRILDELNKTTSVEFVETPLKDIITYLQDTHGIPIVVSAKKLAGVVDLDTPVTKNLKGVTLRSALRLLLGDLDLTYIVKDEVIQVMTPDDAENEVRTKVYPVGDLVVPIRANNNLLGLSGLGGVNGGMTGMSGGPFGNNMPGGQANGAPNNVPGAGPGPNPGGPPF